MLGDISLATANSELSMQMATEHDLAQPRAWSMGVAGWCIAENGDLDRGLSLATQAIATLQAIQSRHFSAYLLGLLADTHLKAGHHVEAMKAVEEGLAMAELLLWCRTPSAAWRAVGASTARPKAQGRSRVPHRHQDCLGARSQDLGAQGK